MSPPLTVLLLKVEGNDSKEKMQYVLVEENQDYDLWIMIKYMSKQWQ